MVSLCNQFVNMLESVDNKSAAESYVKERLNFLPGNTWPENWLFLESLSQNPYLFSIRINVQGCFNDLNLDWSLKIRDPEK